MDEAEIQSSCRSCFDPLDWTRHFNRIEKLPPFESWSLMAGSCQIGKAAPKKGAKALKKEKKGEQENEVS